MRIFVGNLAWTTTEEDLGQLFHPHGTLERVQIITDRDTGRSRGFGFVEMPNVTEAQEAIEALNRTSLGGRTYQLEVIALDAQRNFNRRIVTVTSY